MLTSGETDHLARMAHERYLHAIRDGSPSAGRSFAQLDESAREANRDSVRFLPHIATALGYQVEPVAAGARPRIAVLSDEEIEVGAQLEHLRWERFTRRQGRDDHPDLVPWGQLDESGRELDRMRVRDLPMLLAEVGLQLSVPAQPVGQD